MPKKGGMTVVANEKNELIPLRTVIEWSVYGLLEVEIMDTPRSLSNAFHILNIR